MAYYVTTPIYYVNAEPHLGHAYTTIAADVLARHMRQRGEEVFFLTGTDEHGEPVAQAAERQGVSPRELADRNSERFRELARAVGATNDFFIRTTDAPHEHKVQELVQRIYDNGYVYRGSYEGWYCPRCADFKTASELAEGNRCPIHLVELEREREENWFFRLSAFQEPLEKLFRERPDFVKPEAKYNEARAFIEQGLQDLSLSRARLTWGVPVPWDPTQVIYVWVDALFNYYTALTYARSGEDLARTFWPPSVHLIAKDILKFNAVIWPALLLAAGLELPRRIFTHGYLLMDEHKMSKSLGNVIDPFQVIDTFGSDALRFYLLREVTFGQDGSISPEGFETRYTTELANELGNLASRTIAMVERYRAGRVPAGSVERGLTESFANLPETVARRLDDIDVSGALDEIWRRVKLLNRYVQDRRPWELAKQGNDGALDDVLYGLVDGLRVVAILAAPYLPDASARLLRALASENDGLAEAKLGAGAAGRSVASVGQLFPRVAGAPAG
ncbi:Methionine--tRNA ligase [bacterium HR41]|nr:Methionine--tRNA ligase [bacterium HR41]